jgi:hypothetical protein
MRLYRLLSFVNWKYAVGEFLLIVMGIVVALAVNSWYANQQLRGVEIRYLQRIRTSLAADLEGVSESQAAIEEAVARLHRLKAHLASRAPYSESLNELFSELTRWRGVTLKTSIYESLRARGLDLISNEEMQVELIEVYENVNDRLSQQNANNRELSLNEIIPYQAQHFSQDGGRYVPYDYQALLDDRHYLSLIDLKTNGYETFTLPAYRAAAEDIRRLITLIDTELSNADRLALAELGHS